MADGGQGETVYRGGLLTVRVQTAPAPDGSLHQYEIVEHPDAVAIIALRQDAGDGGPKVALVRQMRPALGRETWEAPAGLINPDEREAPDQAAARELREETGYTARTWRRLGREYPSPGFSTEAITLYLATQLEVADPRPTDPDIVKVDWVPLADALARAQAGEIEDGKTLLGLTLAAASLGLTLGVTGGATMPSDPTNMPFPRASAGGAAGSGEPLDGQLRLETMLMEEFNYASVTAYQAMEDRARIVNLYLLLIGVLASGLGAVYQLGAGGQNYAQPLSLGLLFIAGMLGIVFFLQLIRMRQAHRDSLVNMNKIKQFYIQMFADQYENLPAVFHWRLGTIPGGERFGSVTFLVCFLVAALDSLCLGAAAFFGYAQGTGSRLETLLANQTELLSAFALASGVFLFFAILQVAYYLKVFRKGPEAKKIKDQEARVSQVKRKA